MTKVGPNQLLLPLPFMSKEGMHTPPEVKSSHGSGFGCYLAPLSCCYSTHNTSTQICVSELVNIGCRRGRPPKQPGNEHEPLTQCHN